MKVRATVLVMALLAVLTLVVAGCAAPAATPQASTGGATTEGAAAPAAALGKIKVATDATYPPFDFVDENNNIVGFDIDVMNAIAKNQGFEIEWANTRWDGIFVALANGEYDAVVGAATITDERKQTVDFSDPYYNAGQILAVRADSEIKAPADLDGKRVGVQLGTTGDIWASDNTKADVQRFEEITMAFQALSNGDVDVVLNDAPTSGAIIKANPDLKVTLVGEPFTEELYGIAVRKNRPEVLQAINAGLAAIKESGEYDQIIDRWFGTAQ
jgi:polar amino acid transport system substrate-binding protein